MKTTLQQMIGGHPANPLLGQVGDREQWVEFDLGYEYEGQHMLPYANLEQHQAWLRTAKNQGIQQVCLRIDRYDGDAGQSAILSPWGRLMLTAFSTWDENIDTTPEILRDQWEATQFPGAAEILQLATHCTQRMCFPANNWLLNHCMIPTFAYAKSHLVDGNASRLAEWTQDPEHVRIMEGLRYLPAGFRTELEREASEAMEVFQKANAMLKASLPSHHPDAPRWRDGFQQLGSFLCLVETYRNAFFRIRELEEHPERTDEVRDAEKAIENFRTCAAREAPLWMDRVFTRQRINRTQGGEKLFESIVYSLSHALCAIPQSSD